MVQTNQLENLEELVNGLNAGSIRGNNNTSLSDLGLIASTNGTTLSFTQKRSETQQVLAVELGGVTAKFASPPSSEGKVYVFSRDGRQIAGSALSDTNSNS